MRLITYTVGTEVRKILVDSSATKSTLSAEALISRLHAGTKLELEVLDNEHIGAVYTLPVVQPIGNINGI